MGYNQWFKDAEELKKQYNSISKRFWDLLEKPESVFSGDSNTIIVLVEMNDFKLLDRLREFNGFFISDVVEAELRKGLRPLFQHGLRDRLTDSKRKEMEKLSEFLLRMEKRKHIIRKKPARNLCIYLDGLMKFVPRNFVYDIMISEYNEKSMLRILDRLCKDYNESFERAKSTSKDYASIHEWFEKQTKNLQGKLIAAWMKRFETYVKAKINPHFVWPREFSKGKVSAILWKIAKPLYASMQKVVEVEGRGSERIFDQLFMRAKKSFKADVDIVAQMLNSMPQGAPLISLDSDTQWLPVLHGLAMSK